MKSGTLLPALYSCTCCQPNAVQDASKCSCSQAQSAFGEVGHATHALRNSIGAAIKGGPVREVQPQISNMPALLILFLQHHLCSSKAALETCREVVAQTPPCNMPAMLVLCSLQPCLCSQAQPLNFKGCIATVALITFTQTA